MNWFKRLCLFVFGLAGLLSIAALALTWVGPWQAQARTLILETRWCYLAVQALAGITEIGLLVCLLRSLFAPRNPRETMVAEVNGGTVTVTRNAIVSQTKHVIEEDGTCYAKSIRVRVRKRGHVRVNVRVTPRRPVDVVARGEELYAKLNEGLAQVCGDTVQSVSLVFTEPESMDNAPAVEVETTNESARPFDRPRSGSSDATVTLPSERMYTSPDDTTTSTNASEFDGEPAITIPVSEVHEVPQAVAPDAEEA